LEVLSQNFKQQNKTIPNIIKLQFKNLTVDAKILTFYSSIRVKKEFLIGKAFVFPRAKCSSEANKGREIRVSE
jgi:hypothetical protein